MRIQVWVGFGVRLVDAHNLEVAYPVTFLCSTQEPAQDCLYESQSVGKRKNYSGPGGQGYDLPALGHLLSRWSTHSSASVAVKKPIILYIGKATPRKYRPLIKDRSFFKPLKRSAKAMCSK